MYNFTGNYYFKLWYDHEIILITICINRQANKTSSAVIKMSINNRLIFILEEINGFT